MIVIGRNVKAEVRNGRLYVVCQIEKVIPARDQFAVRDILASTLRPVCVPNTDLFLNLILTRERIE